MRNINQIKLLLSAFVTACSPGGGTSGASGDTTQAGSSSSSVGQTETSAAGDATATSGATAPTSGPGTTAGPGTSSPATSEPVTSEPVTSEPATSEPGTSGTGEAMTSEPGESGGETTAGPGPAECEQDADCKLASDCCLCAAAPLGEDVAACDELCREDRCSELGIDEAVCTFGVCETERLSCDQDKVVCEEAPPVCPPGTLPETSPNCWTGRCVPSPLCDVVPDCGDCGDEQVCVQSFGEGPLPLECKPIPPGCGGSADCACAGDLACTAEFPACNDVGDDAIQCVCLIC